MTQTEMTTVCCDAKKFEVILKVKREGNAKNLKNIIVYDDISEEEQNQAKEAGLNVYSFQEVIDVGRSTDEEVKFGEPKPETVYMFCYTSGTTGDPKGAMITHKNLVSCVHLADHFQVNFDETDVALSYLPYGHTFEQCMFVLSLFKGYSHGYYSGDPLKLMEDIQVLKPSIFCTVPRILNRIYSKIHESLQTKSNIVQWLFAKAVNAKKYYFERDGFLHHLIYDQLVFNKVK